MLDIDHSNSDLIECLVGGIDGDNVSKSADIKLNETPGILANKYVENSILGCENVDHGKTVHDVRPSLMKVE
jgi:hypothetical protein